MIVHQLRDEIAGAPDTFARSAHLWQMQRVLDVYVPKVVVSTNVNDVDLQAFLELQLNKFGDKQKAHSLNLQPVIANLAVTKAELNKWRDGVEKWTFPCDFDAERKELFMLCAKYENAPDEAQRHTDALEGLVEEDKARKVQGADRWRKGREKILSLIHI